MVPLLVVFGVVAVVLLFMLIFRSSVETREQDQIFLDPVENSVANEQRAIVARVEKLSRVINVLWIVSVTLLVAIVGIWLWQVIHNF